MNNKNNKTLNILAKRLKTLRKNQNLTQDYLGKKINISGAMIGHIERGNKAPSCFSLKNIAQYFNVSTDYLLGLTDESKKTDDIIDMIIDNKDLFEVFKTISNKKQLQKAMVILNRMDNKTLESIIELADILSSKNEKYNNK